MLSATRNKPRQAIKMQHDVPVWLKSDFRRDSESSSGHNASVPLPSGVVVRSDKLFLKLVSPGMTNINLGCLRTPLIVPVIVLYLSPQVSPSTFIRVCVNLASFRPHDVKVSLVAWFMLPFKGGTVWQRLLDSKASQLPQLSVSLYLEALVTPDPAVMSSPHALVIEPSCMLPGAKLFSMQLTHSRSCYWSGRSAVLRAARSLTRLFRTIWTFHTEREIPQPDRSILHV